MACSCRFPTWTPAVASTFSGWSAAPQTTHVNATTVNPLFTIAGPVSGIRFRMPDYGGPSQANGDGAVFILITTTQTGAVTLPGWAPAVPVFPATAAGPFTKTQSGITMTVNRDGHLAQQSSATWRLAKQNANPISPEFEWFTIEFSSPVTNILVNTSAFTGASPPNEGVSQLQVLTDGPCSCCPFGGGDLRCYSQEELQVLFSSAVISSNPAGYASAGAVGLWIDQSLAGAPFGGFGTPAGQIPVGSRPAYEFSFATPQNRITRVQEHNQGGGDLFDSDGFGATQFSLISPTGAVLYTGTLVCANGAAPFSTSFPPIDNVAKIRWWDLTKVTPAAGAAPLGREFQAFQSPVRQATSIICNGQIIWVDTVTGDRVDPANFFEEDATQTIFNVAGTTTNDGWIETGTPVGAVQPPNRVLPAPIFNDGPGTDYSPHNGAIGNWVIAKTVQSAVAGPGRLRIPATFQMNADDLVVGIRVNGVLAPFTYGAVVAASSAAVTWLKGANTVTIEFSNTIAGNTSAAGRLEAITPKLITCS